MSPLTKFLKTHGVEQGQTINYEKAIELLEAFKKEVCPKGEGFTKWTDPVFREELAKYKESYTVVLLNEFYLYWSEPTPSGKMRLQLEKTWETGRRLARWAKNNKEVKPVVATNGFKTQISNR